MEQAQYFHYLQSSLKCLTCGQQGKQEELPSLENLRLWEMSEEISGAFGKDLQLRSLQR